MSEYRAPHVLITSGPTRQYLDPVRFISNASSGKMGAAIAKAAIASGYAVTVVTGPVNIRYPDNCNVIPVETTQEMLEAAQAIFPRCELLVGAAAPSDYMPRAVSDDKLKKTGAPITLQLVETPDIIATLANAKRPEQIVIGFALETSDHRFQALRKLEEKCCDYIVLNEPTAMTSDENTVRIFGQNAEELLSMSGQKSEISNAILELCFKPS